MPGQAIAEKAGQVLEVSPLVTNEAGILAILLVVLAAIFWAAERPVLSRFFKVIPSLIFCYFVPTTLTTLGVLPAESALYGWVKAYVLPASLFLLILALDLPAIIRLGPKAVIMMLAGTLGVVIGGPIALWSGMQLFPAMDIWGLPGHWTLPDDAWRGMAALSGSWIGGGANFVALGDIAETSSALLATMVIPDVLCANVWMGVLLFFAGKQVSIDRRTGADTSAIDDLKRRMIEFQERVNRIPSMADLMMILALGFAASWLSYEVGLLLPEVATQKHGTLISHGTWKYILVTTVGVILSFTRARNLEGAGASKIGTVMIYLLVACIGASADFRSIMEAPGFILAGFIWMAIHVIVLLTVAKLIKAPIFFVAVGSQANIGGAASAPVVAAAFHPSLAPVGALLAIAGYVLGTYAGLLCMRLLMWVS